MDKILRDKQGRFINGHLGIGGFGKGSKHTAEAKEKVSVSLRGKTGVESRRWKGDDAGYVAIHTWLTKYYDKGNKCEQCGNENASRLEWSNINGDYTRDRSNWQVLCPSCHRKFDGSNMCKNGHLYVTENTYINPRGHRQCKICMLEAQRRYRAKTNSFQGLGYSS